jgi:flagellar L-ring protein precursor FlgH
MNQMPTLFRRLVVIGLVSVTLSACNIVSRLANVGQEPKLANIENPVQQKSYRPITMPMPAPEPPTHSANSLWRSGARAFFKDQRANRVGDLLTVNVIIEDEASLNNTTARTRAAEEDAQASSLLGIETRFGEVFPEAIDPTNLVDLGSDSSHTGTGTVDRAETVKVKLAAIITQVLPNGNLVISGHQEVRVNFEVRELTVTGIVRPEDISATNTVNHEQIAEARVSYGGRGQLTDVQQPRYGQQLFDIIFPF